jgi:hypothetical protein
MFRNRAENDTDLAELGVVRRNELTRHWDARPDPNECRLFSAFEPRPSAAASAHYGLEFEKQWVATLGSHALLFGSPDTSRSCFWSDKGDDDVDALVRHMVDGWCNQGLRDVANTGIERDQPALGDAAASLRIDFEMVGHQGARHRVQHHELDVLVGCCVMNLHLNTRPQVPLDLELIVRGPLARVSRALG